MTFHVHGAPVGLTAIVLAVFSSIGGCVVVPSSSFAPSSREKLTSPFLLPLYSFLFGCVLSSSLSPLGETTS